MNIEEKLDYFAEVMMGEAAAARKRATEKKSAHIARAVAAALEEAEARIAEGVRAKTLEAKKLRFKQIAAATATLRYDFNIKRLQLEKELLGEAGEKLRAFVTSGAYKGYLEEAIRNAARLGGFSIVQLARRDVEMDLSLPEGMTVEPLDRDFIGGFILFNEARTLRGDFSFQARLAKAVAACYD
ncbi:MAG: hypothetical protein FWC07_11435 [Defluviitaleaceae bacterium]|nr:hypothetical protein [Defluviitaleaceae bacterium]